MWSQSKLPEGAEPRETKSGVVFTLDYFLPRVSLPAGRLVYWYL